MKCVWGMKCAFRQEMAAGDTPEDTSLCGYLYITGQPRGCPAAEWDKFTPRAESEYDGKRRWNPTRNWGKEA